MELTIWSQLKRCVEELDEPFRAQEIVSWFRRNAPTVLERSLRGHIQGATANVSTASRGMFVERTPLLFRLEHGIYRRYRLADDSLPGPEPVASSHLNKPLPVVEHSAAVEKYMSRRDANARYASFDFCFNHFQGFRSKVADREIPGMLEKSCLHLGFYLASWGMLRGSSQLMQFSVRHLVPLVETIASVDDAVWSLDLDRYDSGGSELLLLTARDIRYALQPVKASDTLVTKTMLGVFGCVPAFDVYFKRGFGVSSFDSRSLQKLARYYKANPNQIEALRQPTLDFDTASMTDLAYTRAKVVDMIFFIEGGYPSG